MKLFGLNRLCKQLAHFLKAGFALLGLNHLLEINQQILVKDQSWKYVVKTLYQVQHLLMRLL